ncbi:MAG: S8 family serine peptidase [Planctomycetota bacterium]
MIRRSSKRDTRRASYDYQTLEVRNLLAADIAPVYQPQGITNPFSHGSVSADQILERAEHVEFHAGELIIAIDLPVARADAEALVATFDWSELVGTEATLLNTMMTVDRGVDQSVSLVHLDLGDNTNVLPIVRDLGNHTSVVWSSPNFFTSENPLTYIPNDPQYGDQYHHPLMQNDLAWDIQTGDSSIIIAVTDDGIDTAHPDLAANIWTNTGEIPGNGIDDDGNGYVDDINGWDFLYDNNDPNPNQSGADHGTHVAGITAAVTDNSTGVSGIAGGGNGGTGASIMALQWYDYGAWTASDINDTFVYAVDNGAQLINSSYQFDIWVGDPVVTAALQYIQDNDAIHFLSAGNDNELDSPNQVFEQTLIIASTTSTDERSSFSDYGYGVDIAAPGSSVLSTVFGGTGYEYFSGTSMASPAAMGTAALIWSQNPTWTRDMVVAQLLATADNIDAQNPGFQGQLGTGRANSYNALTMTLGAPTITGLDGLPADGSSTTNPDITSFGITFSQYMDPSSVTSASSYSLVNAGPDDTFGTADDITYSLSTPNAYMVGTNDLLVEIAGGSLTPGEYRMTVDAGVAQNPFGTGLDGDGDGTAGGNYLHHFTIEPVPPVGIGAVGGLAYELAFSGSFVSGTETGVQILPLDANQNLSVRVNGPAGMTITVLDPGGNTIGSATGTGAETIINSIPVQTGGTYVIEIVSGGATGGYTGSWMLNSAFETEGPATGDNNTQANAEDLNAAALSFGASEIMTVTGVLPGVSGTPVIVENFDSGGFGPGWTTASSNSFGRIQVTGQFGTAGGANALVMDSNLDSNYVNNEAIWNVDLSSIANPILAFSHIQWSDETDSLPASFTGSVDGDGVSISDDGVNWYTILNSPGASSWTAESFDLVTLANQYGLTLGSSFYVKFQQYDNFEMTTDGRGYDEIAILVPDVSPDWYSFDLNDGESAAIAMKMISPGSAMLNLYDDAGNLVQSGVSVGNADQMIQFVDPTNDGSPDTWYAEVVGNGARYVLNVMSNATFDMEPNDSMGTAIDISGLGGAFGFASTQSSALAEPDDFPDGTILDSSFAGVTLSNDVGGGNVYGATAGFGAPTGTIVFAPSVGGASGWSDFDNELRADFDAPVGFVSIDVGSDDASDIAFLNAYDSAGNLLATVTSGSVSTGNSETISITRPQADIAYIIAAGLGGDITPLDNLVYEVAGSADWYAIDAAAGQQISLEGVLPGAGPDFFFNGLDLGGSSDLTIELYDPSGVLVATGSEIVDHTALATGTYTIQVLSNGGRGEYFLKNGDDIITIAGVDFGPIGSPLWTGFAAQADEAYTPERGYGWVGNPNGLVLFEGQRGNDLTRDRAFLRNGTFEIDVPDGMWEVDVYLGVIRKTDAIQITAEGTVDTFTPGQGPNVVRSYVVSVTDGQLTLEFDGLSGLDNRIRVAGIGLTPVSPRPFNSPGGKSDPVQIAGFFQQPLQSSTSSIDTTTSGPLMDKVQVASRLAGNQVLSDTRFNRVDEAFGEFRQDNAFENDLMEQFEADLHSALKSQL